jgi:5'-nucleotidase
MAEQRTDLSAARVLVTNDDGIHAPGLEALTGIAKGLSDDVWVVAPDTEQSAASHSLTLRRPLRVREFGPRRFSVDGTPTDCVLVALHRIMADKPATLVLSGINHGANLGEDVTYSGTIAAAMEGALLGVPSIAFSQMRDDKGMIQWATAERHGPEIIRNLTSFAWPPELLVNVNFPPRPPDRVAGIRICRQGRRDTATQVVEGYDPAGREYLWIGDFLNDKTSEPDTDLAAVMDGAISITPLHLDLTHKATLERLEGLFP